MNSDFVNYIAQALPSDAMRDVFLTLARNLREASRFAGPIYTTPQDMIDLWGIDRRRTGIVEALEALRALGLVTVERRGKRLRLSIPEPDPVWANEIIVGLDRVRRSRQGRVLAVALAKGSASSEWSDVAPSFFGSTKDWPASRLAFAIRHPEKILFPEMESAPRSAPESAPESAPPGADSGADWEPPLLTTRNSVSDEGGGVAGGVGLQHRLAVSAPVRMVVAKEESVANKSKSVLTPSGLKKSMEGKHPMEYMQKASEMTSTPRPTTPRERSGKQRTTFKVGPDQVHNFRLVAPLLEQLFGKDWMFLNEDGDIEANPDNPMSGTAIQVLNITTNGIIRKDWRWFPHGGTGAKLLRTYKMFCMILGDKPDRGAVKFLTQLAGRCQPKSLDRIDERDVETVIASYAYLVLLTNYRKDLLFMRPQVGDWLKIWTKKKALDYRMRWSMAVKEGKVPANPVAFMERLEKHYGGPGLVNLGEEESKAILACEPPKSGMDILKDEIDNRSS